MVETRAEQTRPRRKTKIGFVVSNRMAKTIVVEVTRQRSHPLYRRVVSKSRKFYAHDEENTARLGDVVLIEETRPLSKLKRWRLKQVLRRSAVLPQALEEAEAGAAEGKAG